MKRAIVVLSAVAVVLLSVVGFIVLTVPPAPEGPEQLFDEGEVWEVSESLGIGLLLNYTLPGITAKLAGTVVDASRVPMEVARFLLENPYAAENLFSAVLYDIVNRIGQGVPADMFPSLSSTGLDLTTTGAGIDLSAYTYSFNNRGYGSMMGGRVKFGEALPANLAEASQSYYISSFLTTSPLVIDLDGDGVLQASDGTWLPHPDRWSANINLFDINSDGVKEIMEWVGASDGLLISSLPLYDVSLTGSDLFGDSDGWPNGYEKLRTRDLDHDGILEDAELDGLFVWQDSNQDAVTSPTEVNSLAELGVSRISLSHNRLRSTVIMAGETRTIWDWYPNSLAVLRAPDGEIVSVPTLTVTQAPSLPVEPEGEPFNVSHSELTGMGLAGARLVCVTDGGSVVLLQRILNASIELTGRHRELAVLDSDDTEDVRVRHFSIPVAEVTNVLTVPGHEGVIIIGDSGSKILQLDFSTGIVTTLYANTPGEAGFRAGAHGSVSEGHLYVWGAFYSATGVAVREGIVDIPLAGGPMVALTASGEIVSQIPMSALGGSLVAPDSCFFVGRSDSVSIMKLVDDEVVEIDSGDVFHGLWGSRHRVLFILERDEVDSPQVLLHDTLTNTTTPIASGDYSYPVLSGDGSTVVFAEYDYEHGVMTYYLAAEDDGFALHELLQNVPIGPIRLSQGGVFYAYLSVNGLTVGQVATVIA